jgi:hemoglobin
LTIAVSVPTFFGVSADAPSPYERLGGALGVRKLVDRFYDLMSELPEARTVLAMHPEDLKSSREKLYMFLSGWLGGPPLFMERYGHPRLRARHLPFAVDDAARDAWMRCMSQALQEHVHEPLLLETLRGAFQRMADHMRNSGAQARPEDA